MRLDITPSLSIPLDELDLSFVRSSGPGGQNVNKVSTAVQLRFDVTGSPSLPDALKARLLARAGARATKDGVIVITANRHRTQPMNRQDAIDRLVELIAAAAQVPRTRRPTRPTLASKRRRLETKTRRGTIKALRRDKPGHE